MNRLFAIPEYTTEEEKRRASILVATQFASIIMILLIELITLILAPEHTEVIYQGLLGVFMMLVSYFLLRKGKMNAAGWMIAIMGWLILTLDLAFISGIRGVNVLGQVLIVLFAGLAISGRSAIMITIVSVFTNLIILQLEQNGILAQPAPLLANHTRWFLQALYSLLAAVYIWRADVGIKKSIYNYQTTADRYRALFERTNDGVVILNLDWKVSSANFQAAAMLNSSLEDMLGKHFSTWVDLNETDLIRDYKTDVLQGADIPIFKLKLRRKDGEILYVEMNMALVPDADGKPLHIQCILHDITDRLEYEKHLLYRSTHDPLTNLPNRSMFEDRFQLIQSRKPDEHSLVAVLFIDIDEFKLVNDNYGHAAGDQVLVELGARLQESVRESDTVARTGGDEFLIILDNVTNKTNASIIAEKIIERINLPFLIDEHTIKITVSIGIDITERSNLSEVDLIKTSDTAMYQVKESGKNDFKFYETADLP